MNNFLSFDGTIFEDGICRIFGLELRWYAICILIGILLAMMVLPTFATVVIYLLALAMLL